jgi:hypothetical protein
MEAEMIELNSCPFCGGYHVTNEGVTNKSIHCVDCGAYGPEPAYDTNEVDVDWNTRAAPKVKALEWEKLHESFYRVYFVGDVNFRVETYNQKTWICLYSVPGYCNTLVEGEFKSADEAKDAAQSHYEKLILEALE